MQTLEMHLRELVDRGVITKETAIEKTGNQDMFKEQEEALGVRKK
jgi:Tfp pilus assembly pilus retraction ATPase PilT